MSRSLNRDNKHAVEKEQVIKLIRTIIEVGTCRDSSAAGGTGVVPLSEPIMRALIAVAEHPEEPFRSICTQTLSEIRTFAIATEFLALLTSIRFSTNRY
jgi:large subunit ribosomal protein L17e